ncbi:MAG: CopG family ribbon-helix-helix protein [Ignisphaera sp.]|uniref:Putative nickel-responsive regulator n=1 Tax=Ignisphaera aggregans TaxID=334771 RepID=A0A7C4JLT1_9CREN
MTEQYSKPLRVGIYIPRDLAEKLSAIIKDLGVDSISKLVQEALRLYVAEHSWRIGGEVFGAIGVLYDHEVGHIDEELTDLQHKHMNTIIVATHVHVDQRNCLLIIIVRGSSETIKELISDIEKKRGVKVVRLMLIPRH